MKIEVLVAAMNQNDLSLYNEMNLQTDAIIINQCDINDVLCETVNNKKIKFISDTNRGVGRSRNMALLNATAELCMVADEDMVYVDGYEEIVLSEFEKNKDADVIIFAVESLNQDRPLKKILKNEKLNVMNTLKFGACRIAFKRNSILKKNIFFPLVFGGGCKYSSGEDSIFIWALFKNKLKVYCSTQKIADIKQESSCWFTGYDEKYFFDKGALYSAMFGKLSKIYAGILACKLSKQTGEKRKKIFKLLINGIDDFLQTK